MTKFVNRAVAVAVLAVAVFSVGCSSSTTDKGGSPKKDDKGDPTPQTKGETPYIATVPEMEDEGCVANIKKAVMKVDGVASVECDIPNKKATVTPKAGAKLSPRQLWEAFEKSGEKASKLDGPDGLFTSKPEK